MPTPAKTSRGRTAKAKSRRRAAVVSVGCPAGVGPEVSVSAACAFEKAPVVLVGQRELLEHAARRSGVRASLREYHAGKRLVRGGVYVLDPGSRLEPSDYRAGKPTERAGAAQLAYIDAAYDLTRANPGFFLVTGPVSKHAIAKSGAPGAAKFRGHTEWLEARDGAKASVMCFWSPALCTALVTTHLSLSRVPRALTARGVARATVALAELIRRLGSRQPRLAVASLNPHAGEETLLGREERAKIAPGIRRAQAELGRRAKVTGPLGAETAYRKARDGEYHGVVAMYHDQATIPLKLVAFGDAVNVTWGLSIVRTSVDHGTAYDIAWRGRVDHRGMLAALELGGRLAG